jgi:hypothetical protein
MKLRSTPSARLAFVIPCSGQPIQLEQQFSQVGHQQRGKPLVFGGFDRDGSIAVGQGHALDLVEQYRLAHTAQTRRQQALFGPPFRHATEQDPSLGQHWVMPDKLRRGRARSRREGVLMGSIDRVDQSLRMSTA